MEDGIQKYHLPKTASSFISHLSGLITLQLLPWFPSPPTVFSFPVLFLVFKVIWNCNTVDKQPNPLLPSESSSLVSCCSYYSHQL